MRDLACLTLDSGLAVSLDRLWIVMFVPDHHRGAESTA